MSSVCRLVRIGTAVLLLAGGLSCAADDNEKPGATTAADASNVLTITERDYAFDVRGAPAAGTVTIEVENAGEEWHEIAMAKLREGVSLDTVRKALETSKEDEDPFEKIAEEDAAIDDLGGNQFPGTKYGITGSGIEAGDYALMCFVPNADGKPHWSLGMLAAFSIAEGESDAAPESDETFTVDDKGMDGPEQLDAGETTLSIVNDSKINREIALIKVAVGKTFEDVNRSFGAAGDSPPDPATAPLEFFAFVFDSEQDRSMTVDLTPGQWAINAPDPEKPPDLPPDKDPFAVAFTVS